MVRCISAGEQRSGADGPKAQDTSGLGAAFSRVASKWPIRSSLRSGSAAVDSSGCSSSGNVSFQNGMVSMPLRSAYCNAKTTRIPTFS